jgi:hypothetical protein
LLNFSIHFISVVQPVTTFGLDLIFLVTKNLNDSIEENNKERIEDAEDHPNVNHLDVCCCGERLGHTYETIRRKLLVCCF